MIDIFNINSHVDGNLDQSPATQGGKFQDLSTNYKFDLGVTLFQSGKIEKSLPYLEAALKESLDSKNSKQYLYCYSALIQIFTDMQKKSELNQLQKDFKEASKTLGIAKDSQALVCEACYYMYLDAVSGSKNNDSTVSKLLTQALDQILQKEKSSSLSEIEKIQTKIQLMYCLITFSKHYLGNEDYPKSLQNLENVQILVDYYYNFIDELVVSKSRTDDIQEHKNYNELLEFMKSKQSYVQGIKLYTKIIEAQIGIKYKKNYKQAEKILWECYEITNNMGNSYLIPYIFIYMSDAYKNSNDVDQAELFLSLAEKHIQPQQKMLLSYIDAFKKQTGLGDKDLSNCYDLVFNEVERSLVEKHKGCVNFKNQFILLEMLKLFIFNKGKSYSKKDIVEKIWQQDYSPSSHDNKIYVTIKRLREMIEPNINQPQYILRNSEGYYLSSHTKVLLKQGSKA